MACEHIKLPDGSTAIICGTRSRKQFCACGRECEFLCDWKVPDKKTGTCDRPMCGHHATQVGPEKHLCAQHLKAYEVWKSRRDPLPHLTQAGLFERNP